MPGTASVARRPLLIIAGVLSLGYTAYLVVQPRLSAIGVVAGGATTLVCAWLALLAIVERPRGLLLGLSIVVSVGVVIATLRIAALF
jgi:hypothetical protein